MRPGLRALAVVLGAVAWFATMGPAHAAAVAGTESSAPVAGSQLQGAALVAALQRGGHVVYFRHTATDFSRNDSGMRTYDDCDNQRLLSAQGRADAAAIGQRIRALRMGEALASPYCRTMAHARLMLGDAVLPPLKMKMDMVRPLLIEKLEGKPPSIDLAEILGR